MIVLIDEETAIENGLRHVAELMAIAAKTAPKARGMDNIVIKIVDRREELEALAKKMEDLSKSFGEFFNRDAQNIRNSKAVVLIGCRIVNIGLKTPSRWKIDADTVCSIVNLGIAIGSAVKIASISNVDNRVMFSAGVAAQELGYIDADYVFAIPLNVSSKNIYFDRKWP
ncbi:Protein of unknown function DUF2148 [Ignisphaera aggregans DSM 17230]|uniref:DUF2148 domain-containing protein n=1 Tax=Ignisphaera aggregans (strain DSM 17230 / JCM 13409 / AQ1.S1) TaxID=583356 RepID=E0SQR5_IGNAA|nr:Protein of unknown function DUF2148 [Ignisphaera aggregans DSM 17230]